MLFWVGFLVTKKYVFNKNLDVAQLLSSQFSFNGLVLSHD